MEIIVFVKQVPDTDSQIDINTDHVSIKTADIHWVMNPYDEIAVEEAIRIKEKHGGNITIISLGPQETSDVIRAALAMGSDRGVHIQDPIADACDALSKARILAATAKEIGFDLIIAGQRSVDYDQYQVGPAIAEYLCIPQIHMVVKQEISENKITCERTIDGGIAVVSAPLPALITTQKGLNEPRYTSLPGMMKAKKKLLDIKTISDLGLDPTDFGLNGNRTEIREILFPPKRKEVRMIDGESPDQIAAKLVQVLHEEIKVI